jgi:hypothetical protein
MPSHSDDNLSTASSSSSVTNTKTSCPFCETKHQTRYLFKHISNYHPDKIYQSIGTSKNIKEGLEDESLLELDFSQTVYDEDDEFQEFPYNTETKIFGCMGCNQTYTTKSRAKAHWKKSPKCHKDHVKYVERQLKKVEEFEKKHHQNDWISKELSESDLTKYLERLARWYYRLVNLDIPYLLGLDLNKFSNFRQYFLELPIDPPTDKMTRGEKVFLLQKNMKLVGDFRCYMGSAVCLPYDYQLPNPWYLNSPLTFEEEGLPPVGTDFNKNNRDQFKLKHIPVAFSKEISEHMKEDKSKQALEETKTLEPIAEEPVKKEKRPSFTMSNKDINAFLRSPSPSPQQKFPAIISNTKTEKKSVLVR